MHFAVLVVLNARGVGSKYKETKGTTVFSDPKALTCHWTQAAFYHS